MRKMTSTMFVHMIRPRAAKVVKIDEWENFNLNLDESIKASDSESLTYG